MAYKKYNRDNALLAFHFRNIFGGGWEDDIKNIIELRIKPEKIERKLHKTGWHSSDSEIFFYKDGIEAVIHLDEYDSIDIYSKDENCSIEQLENWAKIIDEETTIIDNERLKV